MSWIEQDQATKSVVTVDGVKEEHFEELRSECHGAIVKESENGMRPFAPVRPTPVRSPGIFEAEFIGKDSDIIFHFWPHGYSKAVAAQTPIPAFKKEFHKHLLKAMEQCFDPHRTAVSFEPEMHAWTVVAKGYGMGEFWRKLAIDACTGLHIALGGE